MTPFKIKVTPEQSKIVQEKMFKKGYEWYNNGSSVAHTGSEYLFFDNDYKIYYSNRLETFLEENVPELTFEQFNTIIK